MQKPSCLNGITNQVIDTYRLKQNVYFSGPEKGIPVIFLHGNFSSALYWEETMLALPEGYRGIAPDLRGYGASDKPPRGYDSPTLAADIAGLVRALGERDAVVVGHDWGGHIGWTLAALHPAVVRRLVVLSVPHPLRWLSVLPRDSGQRRASSYIGRFQLPWHPERWIVARDAENVSRLLHTWGGPDFPDPETDRRCRDAMQILYAPHRAMEYYRWAVRSVPRGDGRRYRRAMRRTVAVPTLQLHGALDACVRPATAAGSGRWVAADYEWRVYDGVGHFPHEERPDAVTDDLLRWCKGG
jgi:pimeloyl-ACP methyl ester carboxylesterase